MQFLSFVENEEKGNMEFKKPIYPIEPWTITETEFKKETNYRNETTFALSNGYLGTRGTLEEGYLFTEKEGLEGNFINGFYESENIRYGEWNFGFPLTSQSLLNLPNMKTTKILLAGEEEFDLFKGKILEYKRVLDMKEGVVSRKVVWCSPLGKEILVETKRFCSFKCKNIMVQKIEITPLNFDGEIRVISVLDGKVENHTRTTNPLVDYGPFGEHLICEKLDAKEGTFYYQGTTLNSKLTVGCMGLHQVETKFADACENGLDGMRDKRNPDSITVNNEKNSQIRNTSDFYEIHQAEKNAKITYSCEGKQGNKLAVTKYLVYSSNLDMEAEELQEFLKDVLENAKEKGFDKLLEEQIAYMHDFWERADVQVDGDDALQQGIRFNLFHIMQSAGRDGRTGMGAKGLSGEGYEGHYFWDTEMYVLPVFAYTDGKLAKALLDYRYDTLPQARKRARVLGHEKGALYPWRTINGEEASTYYPLGTAQYHINADIAYAFKLYVDVNGDYEYLKERAAEVLIETARVWADVGGFAESKGGKYCICAVTGPDEYNAIVDNNFYTNLMARENIKDAIWAMKKIKELDEKTYLELVDKLQVTVEEVAYWEKIIENMYFPYDEKRGVYPLDDGFMMRKEWDDSKIPPEKRHLLYENYHPLFIFRQRMSKQADAILGMLLHSNYFTEEELKRNYDFYQEVTLHHSSLSTCIFGILASQIGYDEEAYTYFSQSARMDLDDYHNNFYAGIHAANMAGTWQAIVFGFGGLRTNRGMLEFKPSIPKEWKGYSFKVYYQGSELKVNSTQEKTEYVLLNDCPVKFIIGNQEYQLSKKGDVSVYEKV